MPAVMERGPAATLVEQGSTGDALDRIGQLRRLPVGGQGRSQGNLAPQTMNFLRGHRSAK